MAGRHLCGGGPASTTYGDAFVSNGPSTTCQLSNMAAIQKLGTSFIPSGKITVYTLLTHPKC